METSCSNDEDENQQRLITPAADDDKPLPLSMPDREVLNHQMVVDNNSANNPLLNVINLNPMVGNQEQHHVISNSGLIPMSDMSNMGPILTLPEHMPSTTLLNQISDMPNSSILPMADHMPSGNLLNQISDMPNTPIIPIAEMPSTPSLLSEVISPLPPAGVGSQSSSQSGVDSLSSSSLVVESNMVHPKPEGVGASSSGILQNPMMNQQFTIDPLSLSVGQFMQRPYQFVASINDRPCLLYVKDHYVLEAAYSSQLETLDSLKRETEILEGLIKNLSEPTGNLNSQDIIRSINSAVTHSKNVYNKLSTENVRIFLNQFGVEQILPARHPTQAKFNVREFLDPLDSISVSATGRRFIDLVRELPEFNLMTASHPSHLGMNDSTIDPLILQQLHTQNMLSISGNNPMRKRSSSLPAEDTKRQKISHWPIYPSEPSNLPIHMMSSMIPHVAVQPMLGSQGLSHMMHAGLAHSDQYNYVPKYEMGSVNATNSSEQNSPESSLETPSKKKKRLSDRKTQRTRIPRDTKNIWGFDADDIKREYDLLVKEGLSDKRGFKWSHIAKKIGNEAFLKLGDCGPKLKAVLRRKYPELLEEKVKVPDDPKTEWGFTADEIKNKIIELCAQEGVTPGTPHKNISLSKIGAMLGHKDVLNLVLQTKDGKHKPFAARSDRGQLVHALLKQKYPLLAQKFERSKK